MAQEINFHCMAYIRKKPSLFVDQWLLIMLFFFFLHQVVYLSFMARIRNQILFLIGVVDN